MLEFLQENWRTILLAVISLVSLILTLCVKKNPKIIDNSIYRKLVLWIEEAEKRFKIGEEKKSYVMDKAQAELGEGYNASVISDLIELILSLPQKKEK